MFEWADGESLVEWFGVGLAIEFGTAEGRRREIGEVGRVGRVVLHLFALVILL